MQLQKDLLDTYTAWNTWVIPYLELTCDDEELVRIPHYLVEAMGLTHDDCNEYATVLACDYRNALFSQGHVGALITLLTIIGKPTLGLRNYIIGLLEEYTVTHIDPFKEWCDSKWIEELLSGKVTLNSLLPLMTKWNNLDTKSDVARKFQYIVPLYLLLGNHTCPPTGLKKLRIAHNGMIISTCHIGEPTWRDVFCDVSGSRFAFANIIRCADDIFYLPERIINVRGLQAVIRVDTKKIQTSVLIKEAGDWLSFGAYITLLSKYTRYVLPLANTKEIISKEMTTYIGKLQYSLFSYNQEGKVNGREERNAKEVES